MGMFDNCIILTRNVSKEEIEELKQHHLPIIFMDDPENYYDDVGCFHNCSLDTVRINIKD